MKTHEIIIILLCVIGCIVLAYHSGYTAGMIECALNNTAK